MQSGTSMLEQPTAVVLPEDSQPATRAYQHAVALKLIYRRLVLVIEKLGSILLVESPMPYLSI